MGSDLRAELEKSLVENWDDLATHHAYADWMIEQGDPRGELALCQLALEDSALPAAKRTSLAQREQALLHANRKTWFGKASLSRTSTAQLEMRMERGWITRLTCETPAINDSRKIAQAADLRFLRELEIPLFFSMGTLKQSDLLEGFPFQTFRDAEHKIPDPVYPLACSPYLGNLRRLVLGMPVDLVAPDAPADTDNSTLPAAVLALLTTLPRLEQLSLSPGRTGGGVLAHLDLAGPMNALQVLELFNLDNVDLTPLTTHPVLARLRRLTLHASVEAYQPFSPPRGGVLRNLAEVLIAGSHLKQLQALRVARDTQGDALCAALAKAPLFGRLRELSLVMCCVTDVGAEALLQGRQGTSLRALDLSFNRISPTVLERLLAAYPFLVATGQTTLEALREQERLAQEEHEREMLDGMDEEGE